MVAASIQPRLRVAALLSMLIFLVASRWPLQPQYLYYIDNVSFALSLDDFNPAKHQPAPPGYPLYVLLSRAVHSVVPNIEKTFEVTGIIGSAAALWLLFRVMEEMFDTATGLLASALLLGNPVFWLAGVGNYVRTFLAAGSCAVAWACWRCWRSGKPSGYYAGAALTGIAAGFRPDLGVFLLPLLIATGIRTRRRIFEHLLAAGLLAATSVPWFLWMVRKMGGVRNVYAVFSGQLEWGSQHLSLLYGAPLRGALIMVVMSVCWTFFGALSWFWAVPAALRRPLEEGWRIRAAFLAIWFAPGFLFHTIVHINNPDHALVTIPIVCAVGAWVLLRLERRRALAIAAALVLNVILFLAPLPRPFWTANFGVAHYTDQMSRITFAAIRQLQAEGPVFLIANDTFVTPRQITYYFPGTPFLLLDAPLDAPFTPLNYHVEFQGKVSRPAVVESSLPIPDHGTIAWVLPSKALAADLQRQVPEGRTLGTLWSVDARPGLRFTTGNYRFTSVLRSGF